MAKAYSDEEIEQMLSPRPKHWTTIVDELTVEAESVPLIATVAFFTLGLALGFAVSKK
jgi:hypothetical protein